MKEAYKVMQDTKGRVEMNHMHIMEPYGWVKMVDCRIERREQRRLDFASQKYVTDGTATFVVGTVEDSDYCGALLCGVPVAGIGRKSRYPVGSAHECRIRHASDLERHETRDIAM